MSSVFTFSVYRAILMFFFLSKIYDLFLISWRSWLSSTSVPIKTKTQTVSRPNLLTCWLTNFHSTVRFFVQTFFRLRPWTCQDLSRFLTIFRGLDQYFITQTKKYQYFYLTSLNSTQSWPKLFQPRLRPTCSKLLRSRLGFLSFWPRL